MRPAGAGLGYFKAVDGLRAVAILSVLVYHLRPALLPAGFIGVDIFFVISGFVVTASLTHLRFERLRDLLAYFYARRVVRIVPALVAMLVPVAVLSVLFVAPGQAMPILRDTSIAASLGAGNILLAWRDLNYFDPKQDLNPFLHTWTLGVEEQFYLLFPFFFFFCQRVVDDRRQSVQAAIVIGAVSLVSFLLAWRLTATYPRLAFYLLPGRFWELGCGMLLCLTIGWWRPRLAALPRRAAGFACAVLLIFVAVSLVETPNTQLPLRHLLIAVVASAGLIALVCAQPQALPARALAHPVPVAIGKISYSLYLWHWPVFVLFRWTVGLEGPLQAVTAVALAFAFAVASYRLVEQPIRRRAKARPLRRRRILAIGGSALAASALATGLLFTAWPWLTLNRLGREAAGQWKAAWPGCPLRTSERSVAEGHARSWIAVCPRARGAPMLVVAGDSHAASFAPSLRRYAAESALPAYLYTRPACDFPSLSMPASARPWCAAYYGQLVEELSQQLAPGDVLLLSSLHIPRLDSSSEHNPLDEGRRRASAYPEARSALARLARTGARIVIQAPIPLYPSPPLRCSEWFNRRNPVCEGGFTIERERMLALRRPAMETMQRLAREVPNVEIWDPFPLLCPGDPCSAFAGATPLYWDADHVGLSGQRLLYPDFRRAVRPVPGPR